MVDKCATASTNNERLHQLVSVDKHVTPLYFKSSPHTKSEYRAEALPEECILILSDEEKEAVQDILSSFPREFNCEGTDNDLFIELAIAGDRLPQSLRKRLLEFKYSSNEFGTLLFRNLPVDPILPAIPVDEVTTSAKNTSVSELCLTLLMMRMGDPRGYYDEKSGALIQSVYPTPGSEYKQENTGSLDLLELHTEDGFLAEKCDFLGLICLRSDHERIARTGTASARRAMKLVSSNVIEWLRKPLYRISVPSSFKSGTEAETLWSRTIPVLSGEILSPELCVDLDAMEGLTPIAQYALKEFERALMSVLVDCVLTPGDLLIIDNRTAAHARSSFRPRYDGYDRWLQRLKVVTDPRSAQCNRRPGSRVCGPVAFELFDRL